MFNLSRSYSIAEGLGGLGRSAARWMVGMGAQHLVLFSRSGPKSTAAFDLVKRLESGGTSAAARRFIYFSLVWSNVTASNAAYTKVSTMYYGPHGKASMKKVYQ